MRIVKVEKRGNGLSTVLSPVIKYLILVCILFSLFMSLVWMVGRREMGKELGRGEVETENRLFDTLPVFYQKWLDMEKQQKATTVKAVISFKTKE